MKIYYFEFDPETGIYKAGCKADGKRFVACVWATGNRSYVSTGSRLDNNHRVHWFSQEQEEALATFVRSEAYSIEYKEGI